MRNFPFGPVVGFALLLFVGSAAQAAGHTPDPDTETWRKVKSALFGERPVAAGAQEVIQLEAPARAEDAATVPIAIKTFLPQGSERHVRRVYLIIDKNPSPLAAVFHFSPDAGRADLETRVRIEEYTHVRAVAETSDGRLYAATRYVKASGGCSAPAGKDPAAALARLGRMKLRLDAPVTLHQPNLAQLMISHPNHSGLAMDQLTRLYTPAHYVRQVTVSYAGKPVLMAEVDFSISENPNFRFYFVPREAGELRAEVVDSKDLKFETSVLVRPGMAGGS
jgi:sulfur-oxidizing protein SoxY